jgi:hypothetical protein
MKVQGKGSLAELFEGSRVEAAIGITTGVNTVVIADTATAIGMMIRTSPSPH